MNQPDIPVTPYKKYMWFLYRVNTVQASVMSLNYVYLLLQI